MNTKLEKANIGLGKRKEAVARVFLVPGEGNLIINKVSGEKYLQYNATYLDKVWEFEASLDLAEEVAIDQMLCLLDYCEFEDIVKGLNDQWKVVKRAKIDDELFDLGVEDLKVLNIQKEKLQEAIIIFNQAVEEMEGENLAMTATFLRQAYLEFLAGFGDFISSKHYYASL